MTIIKTEECVNVPTFTMKQGRTTYEVGLFFLCKGKEDLDQKMRKLIKKEVKNDKQQTTNTIFLFV